MHRRINDCLLVALLAFGAAAHATTFTYDQDPFAGTPVLSIPGRQVVGGEQFISFDTSSDVFAFDAKVFGISGPEQFLNALAPDIPAAGANIVVLENFDDDNNALTPFGASNAANLIAGRVGTHAPGFFVYFNQALDIPRLVYSTDLGSTTSDLRILARLINLNGPNGRNTMPRFTQANFEIVGSDGATVPEPASAWLVVVALALCFAVSRPFARRPT